MAVRKVVRIVNVFLATLLCIFIAFPILFQIQHVSLFFTNRPFFYLLNLNDYREFEFRVKVFDYWYIGNSSDYIDATVLIHGSYEKETLFLLRDLMNSISPEGVFVDVGANVGQHSMFMASYASKIHAFDPYKPVLQRFREMIALNEISSIEIHAVGLGAKKASIPFYIPPSGNQGQGSFVEDSHSKGRKQIDLEIVRADDYFSEHDIGAVDLIKIDIEGYEKEAMQGMRQLLESNRPTVVMELNFGDGEKYRDIPDVVSTFPGEYTFFRFEQESSQGCYHLEAVDVDSTKRLRGLVAIPKEKFSKAVFSSQCK